MAGAGRSMCLTEAVPDGLWPKSLVSPGVRCCFVFANCALRVGLPPPLRALCVGEGSWGSEHIPRASLAGLCGSHGRGGCRLPGQASGSARCGGGLPSHLAAESKARPPRPSVSPHLPRTYRYPVSSAPSCLLGLSRFCRTTQDPDWPPWSANLWDSHVPKASCGEPWLPPPQSPFHVNSDPGSIYCGPGPALHWLPR